MPFSKDNAKRTEIKRDIKVLYSDEEPIKQAGRKAPGSISFVPSVAGLIIAGQVVRDILGDIDREE